MKKTLIALLLVTVLLLCACGNGKSGSEGDLPQVMDTNEYLLYQNIFFNGMADDYVDKEVKKTGVFTTIYDAFNDRTRYYVWGYYDNTKCCDWQWELVLEDTSHLPANGSLIEVTATMRKDEAALDGYWFDVVTMTAKKEYKGNGCEIEMTTMSATLERVQLINMQSFPEQFEGKTVSLYGRVYTPTSIQHPYYDNAWLQNIECSGSVPAIGTETVVTGTFSNGVITDCTAEATTLY